MKTEFSFVLFSILTSCLFCSGEQLLRHVSLDDLLTSINQTIDDIVDKPIHELAKVYHSGNLCPFQRKVLSKMAHKETIFIEILGGSLTFGADLNNNTEDRWSHRFEQIMNSGWYGGYISVVNRGICACSIDCWLQQTNLFSNADLIIVDLSVNDQFFPMETLPKYYETLVQLLNSLTKQPALMFHQEFRTAGNKGEDLYKHRRDCPDQTAYIPSDRGPYYLCRRWWEMQDYVAQALNEYSVPFVSYRDLVWPDFEHPPSELPHFWNGLS